MFANDYELFIHMALGATVGSAISAMIAIWWLWGRSRVNPGYARSITHPAIDDKLYGVPAFNEAAYEALMENIETNGEEDLRKLAARQAEGVAFDGAGDPKPYGKKDIPF